MKYLYLTFILGILVLAGCSKVETDTTPTLKPVDVAEPPEDDNVGDQGNNGVDDQVGNTVNVQIVARKFAFEPRTITVNNGDKVILHLKSLDVAHGISLPEFGVNIAANPGEEAVAEFVADKTGEFFFRCSVYCGSGHGSMNGLLIVK